MRLLHEIAIFQTMKSKVIISLFETVRLSVPLSLRNLYDSFNSIKATANRDLQTRHYDDNLCLHRSKTESTAPITAGHRGCLGQQEIV